MRRFLYYVAAAAAVAALVAGVASAAATKDYSGQPCNNLTGGDGQYALDSSGNAVVSWSETTETPTCAKTVYSLYVLDSTGTTQLTVQQLAGGTSMACPDGAPDSTSCISFSIDLGPQGAAPQTICVYGATGNGKNQISDRAPDQDGSCIVLTLTGGISGFGYH